LEARIIPERIERALPGNSATLNAMARLHKHQGKAILAANGFKIPLGRAASNADEASNSERTRRRSRD
jgi:hypothetical protein